jgi:hypothetical protein
MFMINRKSRRETADLHLVLAPDTTSATVGLDVAFLQSRLDYTYWDGVPYFLGAIPARFRVLPNRAFGQHGEDQDFQGLPEDAPAAQLEYQLPSKCPES